MIYMSAFLSTIAVILFALGLRFLAERSPIRKFGAFEYDYKEDEELKKLNKPVKRKIPGLRLVAIILFGALVAGSVMYIFSGRGWLTIIAACLGFFAPKLWLDWFEKTQYKLMSIQLEQAVETMATVIRSGGGLPAALEKAIESSGYPLKAELEQTSNEIKLGLPEPEAFSRLARRVDLPEMDTLSVASELKKDGMAVNMANVFTQIQISLRQRQAFNEEVNAIVAENKLAVWIVSAVPIGSISMMRFVAPEMAAPLFDTLIGAIVMIFCLMLIVVGIFWSLKIANGDNLLD